MRIANENRKRDDKNSSTHTATDAQKHQRRRCTFGLYIFTANITKLATPHPAFSKLFAD